MWINKKKKPWIILSFVAPGLILYGAFMVWQIIDGFRLSFYRWNTITQKSFAGLANYRWLIQDTNFYNSLWLTLKFTLCIMLASLVLGFVFGYLIYLGLRGRNFFRVATFVPCVLSGVAVSYIWRYLYSPSIGLTKSVMASLGYGENISPLGEAGTALAAVIVVALWSGIGVQIMMFNSAFNNIPEDVLEYASIDGCSGWKLIWHMILPLSWDVVKMIIILQMISALRAFDQIFVMTGGGPYRTTEILPMYMYLTAFENFKFGEGNAIAVAIFLLCMVLTVIMQRVLKRDSLI